MLGVVWASRLRAAARDALQSATVKDWRMGSTRESDARSGSDKRGQPRSTYDTRIDHNG